MIVQEKTVKMFNLILRFVCSVLFLQSIAFSISAASQNELEGIRTWPSPDNTRVVLDLSSKPDYKTHYLSKPNRLVIDLNSTINKANLAKLAKNGPVIKKIRESASESKGTFRLVIDLKQVSKARIFSLLPAKPYGHRLVIDLPNNKEPVKVVPPTIDIPEGRNIIVAIDAGHGGDDPGALGKYTYEKKVTLQIARRLKTKIDAQRGMEAFLVRKGDYFVNLNKRSDIARKGKADFLVSIHADGFTSSRPRGASVWVLSNRRATSELGRWMEKHEAHSELLGGAGDIIQDSDSVPFLNKMLLDMSMGNTMDVGFSIGSLVTKELSQVTKMHKKKPVHASLAVLKSPDIPSILVEAGFITNRSEERLLNQAEFQNKIANAVYKGIYKHFTQTPPQGSLFAQKKRDIKHTVRSGESLSVLAKRYSVSSNELKKYNRLKSSSLNIGQVLRIPPNYHVVARPEPAKVAKSLQEITHIVKRGESLSVIASQYNKSIAQLTSHNKLRSTTLWVGQKIKVPNVLNATVKEVTAAVKTTLPAKKEPNQKEQIHKVKSGESLSVIAQKYATTSNTLKQFNHLKSNMLSVGQQLKIPGSGYHAPHIHNVKSGESLSVIASRYNKTSAELKRFNKLRTTSLAVGQKIKIPDSADRVQASKIKTPTQHKVKDGEFLSVIAALYGRTTQQFKAYNKLSSTKLSVGQVLKIPSDGYDVPLLPFIHKVQRGQSLSVIAHKYGVTQLQLRVHNDLHSNTLFVGQKLKIPTRKVEKAKHKVRSGESLSVIAQRYGTTTAVIISANKLRSKSLAVGQVLTIPLS